LIFYDVHCFTNGKTQQLQLLTHKKATGNTVKHLKQQETCEISFAPGRKGAVKMRAPIKIVQK
jgi:hypothetical protein